MSLLQIYQWVCQWKKFENRLTFGEVMGKSLVSCFFLRHSVLIHERLGSEISYYSLPNDRLPDVIFTIWHQYSADISFRSGYRYVLELFQLNLLKHHLRQNYWNPSFFLLAKLSLTGNPSRLGSWTWWHTHTHQQSVYIKKCDEANFVKTNCR